MRLAACSVAVLLCVAPAAPDLRGYRFLVTMVRTGDTELFVIDPATGDATNISRAPDSEERYGCFSPDGKRVAFISDRAGAPNLYTMNADGTNVTRIVETPDTCYMPSWAGDRIAFGKHGAEACIASVKADGTDLIDLGLGHDPSYSPDGSLITFTGHAEGGVTVFVMSADGTNRKRLVPTVNKRGAVFPSFAPDGKSIAYSGEVGEALELFVMALDGAAPRQVTRTGEICTPAAWSPDGRWLSFRRTDEAYWRDPARTKAVYAEKPAGKRPVWVVRPDGTGLAAVERLRFQCAMDGSRAAWAPK